MFTYGRRMQARPNPLLGLIYCWCLRHIAQQMDRLRNGRISRRHSAPTCNCSFFRSAKYNFCFVSCRLQNYDYSHVCSALCCKYSQMLSNSSMCSYVCLAEIIAFSVNKNKSLPTYSTLHQIEVCYAVVCAVLLCHEYF